MPDDVLPLLLIGYSCVVRMWSCFSSSVIRFKAQTQVVALGSNCLYSLSCVTGPVSNLLYCLFKSLQQLLRWDVSHIPSTDEKTEEQGGPRT